MDTSLRDKGLYAFGPFRLDPLKRSLRREDQPVALSPKVFDTLLYLIENPDRVLGKDELLEAIWPGRIVEEGSLSQSIFALRKALSGPGETDRFIVTAPGRGYRFTAPVRRVPREAEEVMPQTADKDEATVAHPPLHRRTGKLLRVAIAAGVLVLLAVGLYAVLRRHAGPATEHNGIVLADFINLSGNPSFDTVLGKVLEIDLAQSPFLSLVPQQRVAETLQLMEQPKDTKLTPELALEVCRRNQGRAMLSGAIAALGSHYVVTLEASDCVSGKSIAQDKVDAARMEDVPKALDRLSARIREGLDESPASIQQFDMPIEQATTSSFEALQAFSLGAQARTRSDDADSIPLFKRAVELDPSFALAYEELGSAYLGLRESELGKASYQRAFDLKDHASENEKLRIVANYYQFLGDFTEAAHSYQVWAQTYPQNWRAWSTLANLYTKMARYPDAVAAGKEALRLNPDSALPYAVLARAYKRSTQFDAATAICRQAIAKGVAGFGVHGILYETAFAQGDAATMAEQVALEKGKPTETWMLDYQAWAAAAAGKRRESGALFEQAIGAAQAQGPDAREEVSGFYTEYIEMMANFGLKQEAAQLALKAPGFEESDDAPFAVAKAGDFERAAALAAALGKRYPTNTEVNVIYRPLTQAVIDLGQGKPREAIAALQPVLPYALRDFEAPSLLGQAELDTGAPEQAAIEFHRILDNRGVDGLSPLYPLAYLGLARALRMQGKLAQSRAAYEQLFAFWKNADADLPILVQAREEYAKP